MLYDIENGIRIGDRDALSLNYDARPLVEGEMGAGTFRCGTCGACGQCPHDGLIDDSDFPAEWF